MPYKDPEKQAEFMRKYRTPYMQEYRDRLKQKAKDDYHARMLEKKTLIINTIIPQKEAKLLRSLIDHIQQPSFKKYSEDEQTVRIQNALKGIDKRLTDMVSDIKLLFEQEIDQGDLEIDNIVDMSFDEKLKKAEAMLPHEELEKRIQKAMEKATNIPVNLPFNNHGLV